MDGVTFHYTTSWRVRDMPLEQRLTIHDVALRQRTRPDLRSAVKAPHVNRRHLEWLRNIVFEGLSVAAGSAVGSRVTRRKTDPSYEIPADLPERAGARRAYRRAEEAHPTFM